MKKSLLAVTALLSIMTTHCAAQSSSLVPNNLTASQKDSFQTVAAAIENPCAEEELQNYSTLATLLEAGKTCHEASILSSEIVYFLQNGVELPRTEGMVKSEAKELAAPHEFNLQNRPRLGSENAPVEIVIFSDFQCPYCARAANTMHKLYEARPDDVSIVFKQMPLTSIHPYAAAAALISNYAHEQGKFWEVHDKLFSNQKALDTTMLLDTLESIGGKQEDVFDPVNGQKYGVAIMKDVEEASKAGVEGTPTVFLNGVQISGASGYERMIARIDAELKAPAPASPEARKKAREKALMHCPYPGLEELYALLQSNERADLNMYTNSLLCPCKGSSKTLHDCAADNSCPAASPFVSQIITRIQENASREDILKEIEFAIQMERTKP